MSKSEGYKLPLNLQLFAEGDEGGDEGTDGKEGDQGQKQDEHMIPKSRFDEINTRAKETQQKLDALLKEKEEAETQSKEKQGEFESLYTKSKTEADTLKADAKANAERLGALEGVITTLLDAKLANIDEGFHELIPTNLTAEQKLAWVTKAEAKGLFGKKEEEPLGMATNPSNASLGDINGLDPLQMFMAGYGKK